MSMSNNYIIREIEDEDYYKGFMNVINIFTRNPIDISYNDFKEYLKKTINQNAIILVAVDNNIVIGTLKILKEYKLHNNLNLMGHIEDVAVKEEYRHMRIGSKLIEKALEYTKDCYKVVLSCKMELVSFYDKMDFIHSGVALTLYNVTSSSVKPSR
jgi:glucosamine-phosphate N-acetyltransferase